MYLDPIDHNAHREPISVLVQIVPRNSAVSDAITRLRREPQVGNPVLNERKPLWGYLPQPWKGFVRS
jgi:hypothetical protein